MDESELEDRLGRRDVDGVALRLDVLAGQWPCAPAESLTKPLRCAQCGSKMRVVEVTFEAFTLARGPPLATFEATQS